MKGKAFHDLGGVAGYGSNPFNFLAGSIKIVVPLTGGQRIEGDAHYPRGRLSPRACCSLHHLTCPVDTSSLPCWHRIISASVSEVTMHHRI